MINDGRYPDYPLFKGLQRPLELMGLQGRYIYWAAGVAGGAIVGFIAAYCLMGFVAGLVVLATSVFAKDNLLDEINAGATSVLAGYMKEHPESMLSCLNLVSVFRKLERSGDHITNIAEEIVFFIDAKVLKHSGKTDEQYQEK